MKLRPRILAECHRDARWQRDALSLARVHVLRRLAEVLEGSYLGEEGEGRGGGGGGGDGRQEEAVAEVQSSQEYDSTVFSSKVSSHHKSRTTSMYCWIQMSFSLSRALSQSSLSTTIDYERTVHSPTGSTAAAPAPPAVAAPWTTMFGYFFHTFAFTVVVAVAAAEAADPEPDAAVDATAEAADPEPEAVVDITAEAAAEAADPEPEAVVDVTAEAAAEAADPEPEAVVDATAEAAVEAAGPEPEAGSSQPSSPGLAVATVAGYLVPRYRKADRGG